MYSQIKGSFAIPAKVISSSHFMENGGNGLKVQVYSSEVDEATW